MSSCIGWFSRMCSLQRRDVTEGGTAGHCTSGHHRLAQLLQLPGAAGYPFAGRLLIQRAQLSASRPQICRPCRQHRQASQSASVFSKFCHRRPACSGLLFSAAGGIAVARQRACHRACRPAAGYSTMGPLRQPPLPPPLALTSCIPIIIGLYY